MREPTKIQNTNYHVSNRNCILFLVPGFPKDEDDTTCIPALQQYIYHFGKTNPDIQIGVVAFQYPYRKRKYTWHGIEIYPCGGKGKRHFYRLLTWVLACYYVLRFRFKFRIAVMHSFWLAECAFIGHLLSGILLTKHVASLMGQDVFINNLYLKYLDYSQMMVTAPSKNAAAAFRNSTRYSVNAITPIGLDVDNLHATMKTQNRTIDILGVGSLIPLKNYRLFIEIIRELAGDFPKVKAVIIGDGEEYYPLEQMIVENGLEKNLELFGKLPRPETIEYMYQSKILLHTSTYESQGYVFLEALYCGLTVVCFDVGFVERSERMLVCSGKPEMVENLKKVLKQDLTYQSTLVKSINETVDKFKQIYAI